MKIKILSFLFLTFLFSNTVAHQFTPAKVLGHSFPTQLTPCSAHSIAWAINKCMSRHIIVEAIA